MKQKLTPQEEQILTKFELEMEKLDKDMEESYKSFKKSSRLWHRIQKFDVISSGFAIVVFTFYAFFPVQYIFIPRTFVLFVIVNGFFSHLRSLQNDLKEDKQIEDRHTELQKLREERIERSNELLGISSDREEDTLN